jgi:hypothetical protein
MRAASNDAVRTFSPALPQFMAFIAGGPALGYVRGRNFRGGILSTRASNARSPIRRRGDGENHYDLGTAIGPLSTIAALAVRVYIASPLTTDSKIRALPMPARTSWTREREGMTNTPGRRPGFYFAGLGNPTASAIVTL